MTINKNEFYNNFNNLGRSHNLLRFAWIVQRTSLNTIFIFLKP
ncbi:hypothetical protein HPHPA11_0078 [Helicobacter pylori Hp A-11]|uniref:Uncharacterized protein n=1 Tax=Helicobacter pylori Hp A-11 TaxID=992035 RepID=N4TI84_HELPX|nr:hypothetical protein HPHPA11_0078 [Helicobacter pylori Hp A-11]